MTDVKKTTYPMLSANSWWKLREKLYSTPNIKITDNFLASLLGIELHSAQVNALNYFKQLGLVDKDGSPTDLEALTKIDFFGRCSMEICQLGHFC